MNLTERKKLNLLVHLASVDGKFEKSEHRIIEEFIREKGLETGDDQPGDLPRLEAMHEHEKSEILYWALRMVQADAVIHPKEVTYCKEVARRLNLDEVIIDHFIHVPVTDLGSFTIALEKFQTKN